MDTSQLSSVQIIARYISMLERSDELRIMILNTENETNKLVAKSKEIEVIYRQSKDVLQMMKECDPQYLATFLYSSKIMNELNNQIIYIFGFRTSRDKMWSDFLYSYHYVELLHDNAMKTLEQYPQWKPDVIAKYESCKTFKHVRIPLKIESPTVGKPSYGQLPSIFSN